MLWGISESSNFSFRLLVVRLVVAALLVVRLVTNLLIFLHIWCFSHEVHTILFARNKRPFLSLVIRKHHWLIGFGLECIYDDFRRSIVVL